ncbi:hypothetical protein Ahy_A08g041009 isoform B [Arachis hypogaea]|uniref:non-specific serine/threonine protein kinase n=1 Tax=Arachis hypogaea TaxID=3818 RepID=A0A445C1E2_ARAHY|nr:hypothetical protein Ahy_A08g041009 isoform A [Arachis hypogaea]RYR44731.1 hypothetical protein Ahy_A08g041009 isoform B [Arachis hypogaea]
MFQLKIFSSWLIFLSVLRHSYPITDPDVEGEALIEFLRALNDSNNQIKDWNSFFVSPCYSWSNVDCSNKHVISLNLASKGFSGTLSPSIAKLKYLVSLELQDNNLAGPLPDYIANLTRLEYLNLAENNFRGSVPATWGRLSSLKHLLLKGNELSGHIPDTIANLTGLAELDLSSNGLTGTVPMPLFSFPIFNFSNTLLRCGSSLDQPCASKPSLSGEDESQISFWQLRRFSWRELQHATKNFSKSNVIGTGGFGKVYKGVLSDGTKVAVKRLADYQAPGGEAAFQREVQLISVAVHKNLLRLIGYCTTSAERILVYPFMENRSVAYQLRDLKEGEKGLDWAMRKNVAFGTAHGLDYLHNQCNPKIIHRDLKAANILLDDNFEAVLGDFGLAKLVDTRVTHVTTQVRGTMGHIAPEYLCTGKSSEKTDVFGYGITLLELVTGQRAVDLFRLQEEEEDVLLLDHIKKLLKEDRVKDIVDRNLETYDSEEVERIIHVALLCTRNYPEERPTMSEIVKMLQGVGLQERWNELEQHNNEEEVSNQLMSHQFVWTAEYSTLDQEAIRLSAAR